MDHSPLHDLPLEIRNRIWQYTVFEPDDVLIKQPTYRQASWMQPGITRTCKQVRQETLHMFYACNIFVAKMDPHTWQGSRGQNKTVKWLRRTKQEYHALIAGLRIEFSVGYVGDGASRFYTGLSTASQKKWTSLAEALLTEGYLGRYSIYFPTSDETSDGTRRTIITAFAKVCITGEFEFEYVPQARIS